MLRYLALPFAFASSTCAGDAETRSIESEATDSACIAVADDSGVQSEILYAGQTIEAGTVTLQVDGDDLTVTYDTTDGWELVEVHLWVGTSLADMPQTRTGNPIPGQFPYASGDITGQTSYTVTIPLEDLEFSCPGDDLTYLVAAHASLRKDDGSGGYQTETGWGDGDRIVDKGNWATYFDFDLSCECDDPPPEPDECETAFAYGEADATCFIGADFDNDGADDGIERWGWSNALDGEGDTYTLYTGAGQCDTDKGTDVGVLTVSEPDGDGQIEVCYLTDDPYSLDEIHLYVGDEPLDRDQKGDYTVAPGQYELVAEELDSDTYCATVDAGDYVVAHAVVCGPAD